MLTSMAALQELPSGSALLSLLMQREPRRLADTRALTLTQVELSKVNPTSDGFPRLQKRLQQRRI